MTVAAVSFDLDGTLYAAGAFRRRYLLQNLLYLRTIMQTRKVREGLRGLDFENGEAFFAEQHRLLATRLGRSEIEIGRQVERLFSERICHTLKALGPRPQAREQIQRLVDAGLKIAVLSDFRVEEKLAALGLDDLPWGTLVASEAIGALKPHPRAFLSLAADLDVAAADVVHVGDRSDTDVAGAKAAGMQALLVSEGAGAQSFAAVVEQILAQVH